MHSHLLRVWRLLDWWRQTSWKNWKTRSIICLLHLALIDLSSKKRTQYSQFVLKLILFWGLSSVRRGVFINPLESMVDCTNFPVLSVGWSAHPDRGCRFCYNLTLKIDQMIILGFKSLPTLLTTWSETPYHRYSEPHRGKEECWPNLRAWEADSSAFCRVLNRLKSLHLPMMRGLTFS